MNRYDYRKLEAEAAEALRALEGQLLTSFLVQIVEPEFNVAILVTPGGTWEICGQLGGELLGVRRVDSPRNEGGENGSLVCRHPPYSQFEGRRITQTRTLGRAWNGHGFELTFEGSPFHTMLIHANDQHDCLTLAVGPGSSKSDDMG
jgi:hypothetical protein